MKTPKSLSRIIGGVLSMSLTWGSIPASAAGGVDGVEFQPIPVNINNRCSALILKGTNKYRGYAFKMPRVVLSVDKNLEDLFEIIPKGNGQYTLRFGLFFPLKEDTVDIRRERSNLVINTCNDDVVLAEVNEAELRQSERDGKTKKPAKSADATVFENKIHTLSPLPVSSIEITLDGFQNMTKTIGVSDNNILNYQNADLIADFNIPDEQTYEEMKAHLTGGIGLSVNIKLNFAARSVNGRAEVSIDTKNIARSLELAAQASGKDPAATIVGAADLRSYMASAIASSNLNIRTEEGDNEAFNRMAYQLIERIASQIPGLPQIPGQSWNPNSCINNPNGYNCQNGGTGLPSFPGGFGNTGYGNNNGYGDPLNTGTGTFQTPPPPAIGTPGPILPPAQPSPASSIGFNLGAVLNVLKQQQNINLVMENLGKREVHSYTTNVVIRGEIPTPGYKTLNVVAGEEKGASLTSEIKAGQEVVIKLPSRRELVSSFEPRTQYFSKDEIRRQGVSHLYGTLQEAISKNLLVESIDRVNGGYVAMYQQNGDIGATKRWWRGWWNGEDMSLWNYSWGMAELRQSTSMHAPTDIELRKSDLESLPMRVMFSAYGTRFKVSQLAQETDKWSGRFEDDQIVLVAKQNLGTMSIRNYDKVNAPANRRAEKYIFEVKEPVLKKNEKTPDGKTLSDLRQHSWVKYSDSATDTIERVGKPVLTPFQIRKSVYVVQVKVGTPGSTENSMIELRTNVGTGENTATPIMNAIP